MKISKCFRLNIAYPCVNLKLKALGARPALACAGSNAKSRRAALLSNDVMTSSCTVNRGKTFLKRMF